MSDSISANIKNKISEDLSPTRNITGFHLKVVSAIAIIWSLFQLWYASPFPFMLNFGMFKGLPARAIHLGFALTLAFLILLLIESLIKIIHTIKKRPGKNYQAFLINKNWITLIQLLYSILLLLDVMEQINHL